MTVGGKPSKGTPKDKRLKSNANKKKKAISKAKKPFPGAAKPFGG